jgi:hypothetical protein
VPQTTGNELPPHSLVVMARDATGARTLIPVALLRDRKWGVDPIIRIAAMGVPQRLMVPQRPSRLSRRNPVKNAMRFCHYPPMSGGSSAGLVACS